MRHAILADKNEQREKDCLKGNDGCQQTEREGIERFNAEETNICDHPDKKPYGMDNQRSSAPGLSRN